MSEKVNEDLKVEDFVVNANGFFPNSELPVLIYRHALNTPNEEGAVAHIFESLFKKNDWGNNWVDSIYDFHHYHSNTHEVLGISSGIVQVQLGGPHSGVHELQKGDVLILPAGMAHKKISASIDFSCVGGYPGGKDYDMNYGKEKEFEKAAENIRKVALPQYDPICGEKGKILLFWA